jgi:hypothetical protein
MNVPISSLKPHASHPAAATGSSAVSRTDRSGVLAGVGREIPDESLKQSDAAKGTGPERRPLDIAHRRFPPRAQRRPRGCCWIPSGASTSAPLDPHTELDCDWRGAGVGLWD